MPSVENKKPGRRPPNSLLNRALAAYAAAGLSEWMMWVAVMVYAYEHGGAKTAGLASIGVLLPAAVAAPFAGRAADGAKPNRVFVGAIAANALVLGIAAIASASNDAVFPVTAAIGVAVACLAIMRPAAAVVVPGLVRSARELTLANVRFSLADNISALAGPVLTAIILALSGPTAALATASALNLLGVSLTLSFVRSNKGIAAVALPSSANPLHAISNAWRSFEGRAAGRSVLLVCGAQYLLIGSLELLLVVLANDQLDMARSGPALLGALFGAGSVLSGLSSGRLLTDRALAPFVVVPAVVLITALWSIALIPTLVVVIVALPIAGYSRSLMNLTSRILLQRSAPGESVASVFALVEMVAVVAQITGALIAQAAIAIAGVRAALVCIGVLLAAVVTTSARSVRRADEDADTPIVTIRLLRAHPIFAPLQPQALEAVARAAIDVSVSEGTDVIRQGDEGDRFYVVADGQLDVVMDGEFVRSARRGDSFGEVALLADVARTATVTAERDSHLVAIDRVPFLSAVTGHGASHRAAWSAIRSMELRGRVDVEAGQD